MLRDTVEEKKSHSWGVGKWDGKEVSLYWAVFRQFFLGQAGLKRPASCGSPPYSKQQSSAVKSESKALRKASFASVCVFI